MCVRRVNIVVGLVLAGAIWAPSAGAEINGAGPEETPATAFGPLNFGVTYSGAFTTPADVDYLSFRVAAGHSVHVTVTNTLQQCVSPDLDDCPVYATLMDSTDQQVGGSASDAGTIATTNDTEIINWTFSTGGTYYVLMESNGNLPNGSPTYSVRIDNGLVPVGGGGVGKTVVRSLRVPAVQHGYTVRARYVLAQAASLVRVKLSLLRSGRKPLLIADLARHHVTKGPHTVALKLPLLYQQAINSGRVLKLRLKLIFLTPTGVKRTFIRSVTLKK